MSNSFRSRLFLTYLSFIGMVYSGFCQSQPGYEKTAIFSGLLPDKTEMIFYFTVKGERASSASATFVPQGNYEKAKQMNLYLMGKGSPFPQWKGIKMSADPPKDTTPQEVMYMISDADRLYLADHAGHIIAVLDWHYEGPVEGRGTACTTCLDKKESFQALRRYFIDG